MNPDLVYVRTPEGERLARTPRQIASYAQRATLLLVDGHLNVGELLRRFGETLPIEEVLETLERDGLVHPKSEGGEAPAAPPAPEPDDVLAFGQDPLFDPQVEDITEERLIREAPPEPALALSEEEGRQEPTLGRPSAQARPAVEPPAEDEEEGASHAGEAEAAVPSRWSAAPGRLSVLRRKAGLLGLGALALAVVVGMALWLAGLRPQVEARASAALGVPVRVSSLGLAIRYGPALSLSRVALGQPPTSLVLGEVEVMPDPRRGDAWSAVRLRVADTTLKPSELNALARMLMGSESVTEVIFTDLRIQLGELKLAALAGSLERMDDGGAVFRLADPAGGFKLEARPVGAGLQTELAASPGALSLLGKPKIGSVELRGLLDDVGLHGGELGMTGYGGKFEGSLAMAWAGPVSVEARLRMAAVSMNQLSRGLFERGGFSEGQASGSLVVEARAPRWEELTRLDRVVSSFTVERGALKGFDLGAALRERSPRPLSGGETRFESLRGRLEAGPKEIRLWLDRLDSGAMSASGSLTVAELKELRGTLSAAVQVPGRGALHYPAQLAGTVAQPSIQLRLPAAGMVMQNPPTGEER